MEFYNTKQNLIKILKNKLIEVLIEEIKVLSKLNKTLLGRVVKLPMADSFALYIVSKVNIKTVKLVNVQVMDNWKHEVLGDEGTANIESRPIPELLKMLKSRLIDIK